MSKKTKRKPVKVKAATGYRGRGSDRAIMGNKKLYLNLTFLPVKRQWIRLAGYTSKREAIEMLKWRRRNFDGVYRLGVLEKAVFVD